MTAHHEPSPRELPGTRDLIPLERVPSVLPSRPHCNTVRRWASKGCRGVRLRTVSIGRKRCTTDAWLMEFFDSVERARPGSGSAASGASLPRQRRRTRAARRQRSTQEVLRRHGLTENG